MREIYFKIFLKMQEVWRSIDQSQLHFIMHLKIIWTEMGFNRTSLWGHLWLFRSTDNIETGDTGNRHYWWFRKCCLLTMKRSKTFDITRILNCEKIELWVLNFVLVVKWFVRGLRLSSLNGHFDLSLKQNITLPMTLHSIDSPPLAWRH